MIFGYWMMNTPALIALVAVGVFVLLGILYLLVLCPPAQRRFQLRRQALSDYHNARGSIHLKMMREAFTQHEKTQKRCRSALEATRLQKANIEKEQEEELRRILEAHILNKRLLQIRGLNSTLTDILYTLAQGGEGLRSLHTASRYVRGIGPVRQAAIDDWLTRQFPVLLAGDFPGKAAVLAKRSATLRSLEKDIDQLAIEGAVVKAKLDRLQSEIDILQRVDWRAFYHALRDPLCVEEGVEHYLRGVFAVWEPAPDWFREIVEGAS